MTFWITAAVLWWVIGMAGFVWCWTARYDFTTKDVVIAVMSGMQGPFAWLFGWLTLIRKPWAKTILRKRAP